MNVVVPRVEFDLVFSSALDANDPNQWFARHFGFLFTDRPYGYGSSQAAALSIG